MGELMPVPQIVALQAGVDPVLYGPADRDPIFAYKVYATNTYRPDVLVLGSSRVLQFRAGLLSDQDQFYNAAGQTWRLRELNAFINALDADYQPQVLLLGLDQVWFNADFVDWEDEPNDLGLLPLQPDRFVPGAKRLLDDLIAEDVRLENVIDREEWVRGTRGLGLHALKFGQGYRNDGSFQEGNILVNPALAELARENDLERAPDGWRQFVQGNEVDETALAELDRLLQTAQQRDIFVIGFSPPYIPSIYDVMIAGGKTEYLIKAPPRIQAMFAAYDYPYFDFTDPRPIGGSDEELYDGWHATERLSLRMYLAMMEAVSPILDAYSDKQTLESLLQNTDNPIEIFTNPLN